MFVELNCNAVNDIPRPAPGLLVSGRLSLSVGGETKSGIVSGSATSIKVLCGGRRHRVHRRKDSQFLCQPQFIESRALPCGFRVHAFARSRVLSPRCVWLHVAPSFAPVEARSRCALTEPEHRAIERANARTRERKRASNNTIIGNCSRCVGRGRVAGAAQGRLMGD